MGPCRTDHELVAGVGGDHGDPNLTLVRWRVWFVAALAGLSVLVWLVERRAVDVPGLFGTLGMLATSVGVCWAAAWAGASRQPLLVGQILLDVVGVGFLVHFTGGPYSFFPLAFCVPIVMSAMVLESRWSTVTAGLAAVITGAGHFGLALGWLWTGSELPHDYLAGWPVLVTAVEMAIFMATGLISSDLSRRIQRFRRDRNMAAARVRQSRYEVRNILDNIQSGLITVDAEGVVTRANPACCQILHLSALELVGRKLAFVLSGGMEELADIVLPVATGATPVSRGEVTIKRSGRAIPLGLNVNHVIDSQQQVAGAIAIFADLTHEKELTARIREADRMAGVGELAASIAHEIRNPLASIRGSAELLAEELELEGQQRQLFELVLKESGRVNTIITDFLTFSRMRPAQIREFSAADWRDEINLQVRQHINSHGGQVRLICDAIPSTMTVAADPEQLTQVALNLAINACQAMNYSGSLKLILRSRPAVDEFELLVTDTGPGIDETISDELFKPFKTTKVTGTGLGLAIVARIAAAHGGEVAGKMAAGGGAEFRMRWPAFATSPESAGYPGTSARSSEHQLLPIEV